MQVRSDSHFWWKSHQRRQLDTYRTWWVQIMLGVASAWYLSHLASEADRLGVWAEQCPCPEHQRVGPALRKQPGKKRLSQQPAGASNCSLKCCRAPELATGEAMRLQAAFLEKRVWDFTASIGRTPPQKRSELLGTFHKAIGRLWGPFAKSELGEWLACLEYVWFYTYFSIEIWLFASCWSFAITWTWTHDSRSGLLLHQVWGMESVMTEDNTKQANGKRQHFFGWSFHAAKLFSSLVIIMATIIIMIILIITIIITITVSMIILIITIIMSMLITIIIPRLFRLVCETIGTILLYI